jgi:hypothetical protein
LRANTSAALETDVAGTPQESLCSPGIHTRLDNYLVASVDGSVTLDTHSLCGTSWLELSRVALGTGDVPAIAIAENPRRALIVFSRSGHLMGRTISLSGPTPVPGSEFEIMPLVGVHQLDLIYNQQSHRFIASIVTRLPMACRIYNVVLTDASTPEVVVRPGGAPGSIDDKAIKFGDCDGDTGGHRYSVGYNPRGDGDYVWWRQDRGQNKLVMLHGPDGAERPVSMALSTNPMAQLTASAAENLSSAWLSYILVWNNNTLGGLTPDKRWLKRPYAIFGSDPSDTPLAARSLRGATVVLSAPVGGASGASVPLSLIVAPQP